MSLTSRALALLLSAGTIAARLAGAQDAPGRITGQVTESTANQPIAGVNVAVVGTRVGARTGPDGRFTLTVAPGRYQLRASRIGFSRREETVTVAAGQTATVSLALQQVSVTLDQMVVVGYGTQRRSDLTGAVASVTPNVDREPIASLEQTLQGTAPGVQVTTASSAPGGGISIRIRGGSSLSGSNEPLYVIDGFPVENDPGNATPTSGGRDANATVPPNPLATINPSDIASIEILKDASATSIYGARGANGVVIITTKRGSGGKPRLTIDSYTGVQNVARKYDLLDGPEFAQFANTWATTRGLAIPFPDSVLATLPNTDWQSLIFRPAGMNNVQMSVAGGSTGGGNETRYALSGGVLQQDGIVRGSNFGRVSLRGVLDQQVGSRIRLGSNLSLNRARSNAVPTDGSFNQSAGAVGAALQYIPIMPVRRPDGSFALQSTDFPAALTAIGVPGATLANPLGTTVEVNDALGDTRILANATGDLTLVDGLTFRANIGADLSDRTRDTYFPRTSFQGQALGGRAIRGDQQNTSWLNEYTLSYDHSFGAANRLQAVTGYTRQQMDVVRWTINNTNFISDQTSFEDIGAGNQTGGPNVSSGHTRWTLASYLGRLNYTLLDRYLFTVTSRRDGSSRFGASNHWGVFPSAAFGWRISEEPFLRNATWMDQLKLRVSYGVAGNPSISPYQSMSHLGAKQVTFGGNVEAGYYDATIGNPALTWESTKQLDEGLDLGLWHDRLDLTADHYHKRTDNLLLQIDLPPQTGYSSAYVNAGAIQNVGIEIGLTLRPIVDASRRDGTSWTTTINFARNRNKVLSLGGVDRVFATTTNADVRSSGSMVQVGQPIGIFYGYRTAGLFRDSTTLQSWLARTRMGSGTVPGLGSTIFVDTNGDGVIDANDRTIIGNPNPDFTAGWQNTVSWRGFQLAALLDGSWGAKLMNLNLYRLEGTGPSGNVLRERYYDAWSPTNPNGKYARVGTQVGVLGSDFTDEIVEDGSYLRLRTVSLARELPRRWLARTGVSLARLYVTGQNLHTWTKYSGFNPDVSSLGVGNLNRGIDVGAYPLARTVILGVNLSY